MQIKIVERKADKTAKIKDHIGLHGEFRAIVHEADGTEYIVTTPNIIADIGIKHLGDILNNDETSETHFTFLEPGSGTTTPVIGNTDTETPLTPAARKAVTNVTRSTTSPFEVTAEVFLGTGDYTRPQTINELCVFFADDPSGDMFARGVLGTPITLVTGTTVTLQYSIIFR